MLIVGDIAIKELNPDYKDVKNIEVIASLDQHYYVENVLKAPSKYEKINNYTRKYNLNNGKTLYIYNSNEYSMLNELLELTFSKKWKYIYSSPSILYCIEMIKTTEMFHNVYNWEKAVLNFNFLFKNYIIPIKNHENNILTKLDLFSNRLYRFVIGSELIDDKVHIFRPFNTYKENDLHNIYQFNNKKNYNDISYGNYKSRIYDAIWKGYSIEDKINCVLERAYVLTINEFVIPYWLENKKLPQNKVELIKKSLMLMCSNIDSDLFIKFIIYHYNIIITKINPNYIDIYSNAVKYNDLKEIN